MYLKNVVKVIYQCTVEINKMGVESALGKEIFSPLYYFSKKYGTFQENCEESFLGSMIIFEEKGVYYDKN